MQQGAGNKPQGIAAAFMPCLGWASQSHLVGQCWKPNAGRDGTLCQMSKALIFDIFEPSMSLTGETSVSSSV